MDEEFKGNADIEKALQDFNTKSAEEAKQKSPDVLKTSEIPKMVGWVMKYSGGVIKQQKNAEYVLLGFVILALSVSLFLFFGAGNINSQQKPTVIMLKNLKQMPVNK